METLRRKLVWLVVSRAAVLGALFLITISLGRNSSYAWPVTFLILIVSALSLIYVLALKARVPTGVLVPLQLVNDILLVTWLVYRTGDVESPFTALFLVVVFVASLLSSRNGILAITMLAVLAYSVLSGAILSGSASRSPGYTGYSSEAVESVQYHFAFTVVALLAVSILSMTLADRQRRSDLDLESAQKRLSDLRAFNERIIDSMRSGLLTIDLDGRIATFNRAAEEITGYSAEEAIGAPVSKLFGDLLPQVEAQQVAGDGAATIRAETVVTRRDGSHAHLGFNSTPLTSPDGAVSGAVVIFQDLTEVIELEQEVRRQEKLAALGEMAAGLAHEIRNPLASMRGSIQVLAGDLALDEDQQRLMNIVLRESDRLNRTVSDFMLYARNAPLDPHEFDLRQSTADAVSLLRNSPEVGPKHEIVEDLPAEAVPFFGDPNKIRQVFWNLARNALQSMPNGGRLTVRLEQAPSRSVWITIADEGVGMSQEQIARLFEPFSPSSRGGLGLGMAIVYRLVTDHGGSIAVDSSPGAGTRVQIRLPVSGTRPPRNTSEDTNVQTADR